MNAGPPAGSGGATVRSQSATVERKIWERGARITDLARHSCVVREKLGARQQRKPDPGEAELEPLGDWACRRTFEMACGPEGALETPGERLAAADRVVAADLVRSRHLEPSPGRWFPRVAGIEPVGPSGHVRAGR